MTRASYSSSHARGFSISSQSGQSEQGQCEALQRQVNNKVHVINIMGSEKRVLEDENRALRKELLKLKEQLLDNLKSTNSTVISQEEGVTGVVHPTRRKQLSTTTTSLGHNNGPR